MSMSRTAAAGVGFLALVALATAACGGEDEPAGPDPVQESEIPGSYAATTLVVSTPTEGDVDLLDAGAELTIVLAANGSTSGRLFVPEGNDDGSDLDVNLDGTWSFSPSTQTVTFDQAGDTFVRDLPFSVIRAAGDVALAASAIFGATAIEVVLER